MSRAGVCATLSFLGAAACGAAHAATVRYAEPLRGFNVAVAGAAAKPAPSEPTTLSFNAFSRDFTLELEPNGRLATLEANLGVAPGTRAYRGKVAGRPSSWVRLVLTPEGPSGIVFDGTTLYGIESGGDSVTDVGGPAMFRLADVYLAPGELACEVGTAPVSAAAAMVAMKQEFPALEAAGATLNLDLGAVADFEFSQAFGASAQSALLTRFNNVDGIFSEQLGVQISVATVAVFSTSNDPFTATAASSLLDELATYRGATPSQDAQGLTHLFTGRDLDGSTAGIAFLGAVCAQRGPFDPRSFGAGLSEARRGALLDSLVAAHEIGHNFGAPHDGESPCDATPPTFLMAPSVNGSDQFSPCSIAQMQPEIAGASCLTPIGPADLRLSFDVPSTVLAGVAFTHSANVANIGADPATSVTFTASADPGLSITSASGGGANCTTTASTANCALGTVGGGSSRAVTLNLVASSAGTFDLTGTVTADSDDDGSNNDDAVAFTAVPAVDLVVTGSATQVSVDQQATINATVENTSDFGATGVVVTAVLASGLRADQATIAGTACAISGVTITCPSRTLAAHTSAAFAITATALAAGGQLVTVTAASTEAERAPSNNQAGITVSVAGTNDDDGGGGALSWWIVALLAATWIWQELSSKKQTAPAIPCRRRP